MKKMRRTASGDALLSPSVPVFPPFSLSEPVMIRHLALNSDFSVIDSLCHMSSPESPAEGADLSDFGWSGRKEEGEREDSGESAGDGGIGLGGGKRNGEGEEDKVMMVIKTGGGGEERTGFNGEKEGLKRGKSGNRRRRKRKEEESGKK